MGQTWRLSMGLAGKYVLMAGVAHDEADVVLGREVDGGGDLGAGRDVDGVRHVVSEGARNGFGEEGIAALVGKVRLHHRGRRVEAIARWLVMALLVAPNKPHHHHHHAIEAPQTGENTY